MSDNQSSSTIIQNYIPSVFVGLHNFVPVNLKKSITSSSARIAGRTGFNFPPHHRMMLDFIRRQKNILWIWVSGRRQKEFSRQVLIQVPEPHPGSFAFTRLTQEHHQYWSGYLTQSPTGYGSVCATLGFMA
jgi:hypothetical protein